MERKKDRISSATTFGEAKTKNGQLVNFGAHPDDVQLVKEFFSSTIKDINIPTTKRVNVPHGGHGRYTRYDIVQHEYGGGGPGYIEVLEIKNPPEGRCGFVVHHYTCYIGSDFFEFDSVENAVAAWKVCWASSDRHKNISQQKGFLRMVRCGVMTPWFYAVGDQLVEGDYVCLDMIREDAEFKFGHNYIVWEGEEKVPAVKRCMGIRIFTEKEGSGMYGGTKEKQVVTVYWDDGTSWKENRYSPRPRLMQENELWIQEAMDKFRELLTGRTSEFSINFLDGSKFVGKWKPQDGEASHAEGNYSVRVHLKGGKTIEGGAPFKPTAEAPTLKAKLNEWAKQKGHEVERYEVVKIIKLPKGKKWSGVYAEPLSQ